MQLTRHLPAEADTLALGAAVAAGLRPGMVIYLRGDLGAGKTTLARGILHALGVTERIKSPTYTLVEPYNISSLYLYHFDFYRLRDPEEWEAAGFREYFGKQSICLIEWPERVRALLPTIDLQILLEISDPGRRCIVTASSEQ
ncbi:MAG TPA: tRNA (adenosine(37)-N6)-threonylcarbamoyltransferase complex ATPase subunit type 1 TsaE, partial [Burkholderiales bacterium]|nr:tRNA (adenosine(37)-N6)-threonylcarbamoyltransferase complex ATPase subunit type 1 TsaE [Burkholderiales bacterium]